MPNITLPDDPGPCERDECASCGQAVLGERDPAGRFECYHCRDARHAPHGPPERLFEPAAVQMPGQTWIGDDHARS